MKTISTFIAALILTFAGVVNAGDILLKEADSDFVVQSVTMSGKSQDVKQLELTHIDVRQGMMSYRFAGKNLLTACRGVYSQNPFTKLFDSQVVTGLRCSTQNGKFVVNYLKAH
ncbi:MAG: hypothetical protein AABZ31_14170 [Bdellovibrionota bacterium]